MGQFSWIVIIRYENPDFNYVYFNDMHFIVNIYYRMSIV